MCRDCVNQEKQRVAQNHEDWNTLFDLASKATTIKVYCKNLAVYVTTQDINGIMEAIASANVQTMECPSFEFDDLAGILYIG